MWQQWRERCYLLHKRVRQTCISVQYVYESCLSQEFCTKLLQVREHGRNMQQANVPFQRRTSCHSKAVTNDKVLRETKNNLQSVGWACSWQGSACPASGRGSSEWLCPRNCCSSCLLGGSPETKERMREGSWRKFSHTEFFGVQTCKAAVPERYYSSRAATIWRWCLLEEFPVSMVTNT